MWTYEEAQNVGAIPDYIKKKYTNDRIWVECHGEVSDLFPSVGIVCPFVVFIMLLCDCSF